MTIPDHDARLLPPDDGGIGPCRECGDYMEDHDFDGETGAYICQIDGCDCNDGSESTRDDWEADEADRAYAEMKESGPWD